MSQLPISYVDVRFVAHATEDDVRGKHVIGNLPLHLAAKAAKVTIISMDLNPAQRGKDLSPAQMNEAGATLQTFMVEEI